MKIDVYAICRNEELILPFFIKHYGYFARNITIYDNGSTDGSVDIMTKAGINVIPFYAVTDSEWDFWQFNNFIRDIKNNSWKQSDADWVIVCDTDEFLYHPNIIKYLEKTKYTFLYGRAYEMMSENIPTTSGQIYEEIKSGYPIDEFFSYNVYPNWKNNYSKGMMFKPSEISEVNYGLGAHDCNPIGNVISNVDNFSIINGIKFPIVKDDLKMLHYKYVSREHLIKKHKDWYESGRLKFDEYKDWTDDGINKQYDSWLPFCKTII